MTTLADRAILPCDSTGFRTFMSQWPTGVTVVTTAQGGTPVGCTVNAMMSVSLTPILLAIALNSGTRTLEAVHAAGRFGINLLCSQDEELCQRFARRGLADRFADVAYRWHRGVPLLEHCMTAVVCEVRELIECGDHNLVVGAPLWHCMSTQDDPLLFYQSTFRRLAEPEGTR
jgi:flavin reductase (DIM6/NTAB) family NADH-FMN oxidoreductase RutF